MELVFFNNNALFYINICYFFQTGAHSTLQSKEQNTPTQPKQTSTNTTHTHTHAHTHTHTHTVNRIA